MNVKYSFEVWTKDGMKLIAHGNAKDPDHAVERMKPHMKRGYEGVLIQDGEPIQRPFKEQVRAILDADIERRQSERIAIGALKDLEASYCRPVPTIAELKEAFEAEDRIYFSKSLGPIILKKKD